jgi:ADP-ribose pyrophosphatase
MDFDVKLEGPCVSVLALTRERSVILARQFRPGPDKVLLELPGGGIEACELPDAAAARELLEETGYVGDLRLVGQHFVCAYSTRVTYDFVAIDCESIQAQRLDDGEFIQVVHMPLDVFRAHVRSGELTDMATALRGLLYLDLL